MNIYLQRIQKLANNKYIQTYIKICKKAQNRANSRKQAVKILDNIEGHHIIPKSFKLVDEKDKLNIVYLSAREHFICHKLLVSGFNHTKYYWKCVKAVSAFSLTNNGTRIMTSHQYEYIRLCHRKFQQRPENPSSLSNPAFREKLLNIRKMNNNYFQTPKALEKMVATRKINNSFIRTSESIKKAIITRTQNGTLNPNTPESIEKARNTRIKNGTNVRSQISIDKQKDTVAQKIKNGKNKRSIESINKQKETRIRKGLNDPNSPNMLQGQQTKKINKFEKK